MSFIEYVEELVFLVLEGHELESSWNEFLRMHAPSVARFGDHERAIELASHWSTPRDRAESLFECALAATGTSQAVLVQVAVDALSDLAGDDGSSVTLVGWLGIASRDDRLRSNLLNRQSACDQTYPWLAGLAEDPVDRARYVHNRRPRVVRLNEHALP
jgi:hypothetical protein